MTATANAWIYSTFPNGTTIGYRDSDHRYVPATRGEDPEWPGEEKWVHGDRLQSVSTLVKPLDYDASKLMGWAVKLTREGIAAMVDDLLIEVEKMRKADCSPEVMATMFDWLTDQATIHGRLKEKELTHTQARDKKGDVGTAAHLTFEALARGKDPQAVATEDGYGEAVVNWWLNKKPYVVAAEQFVYSEKHQYAGRYDLKCLLGGRPFLVDLKTSKYIGESYHAQLAGYDLAARECGLGGAQDQMVLKVKEDGTYEEIPCQASHEDFLAAVTVYRAAGRIRQAAKG